MKHCKDTINSGGKGEVGLATSLSKVIFCQISNHMRQGICYSWTTIQDLVPLQYFCQMIMSLTSACVDKTPLFYNVDLDWKGVVYVFQFTPEL